jgi:hypothetical protein
MALTEAEISKMFGYFKSIRTQPEENNYNPYDNLVYGRHLVLDEKLNEGISWYKKAKDFAQNESTGIKIIIYINLCMGLLKSFRVIDLEKYSTEAINLLEEEEKKGLSVLDVSQEVKEIKKREKEDSFIEIIQAQKGDQYSIKDILRYFRTLLFQSYVVTGRFDEIKNFPAIELFDFKVGARIQDITKKPLFELPFDIQDIKTIYEEARKVTNYKSYNLLREKILCNIGQLDEKTRRVLNETWREFPHEIGGNDKGNKNYHCHPQLAANCLAFTSVIQYRTDGVEKLERLYIVAALPKQNDYTNSQMQNLLVSLNNEKLFDVNVVLLSKIMHSGCLDINDKKKYLETFFNGALKDRNNHIVLDYKASAIKMAQILGLENNLYEFLNGNMKTKKKPNKRKKKGGKEIGDGETTIAPSELGDEVRELLSSDEEIERPIFSTPVKKEENIYEEKNIDEPPSYPSRGRTKNAYSSESGGSSRSRSREIKINFMPKNELAILKSWAGGKEEELAASRVGRNLEKITLSGGRGRKLSLFTFREDQKARSGSIRVGNEQIKTPKKVERLLSQHKYERAKRSLNDSFVYGRRASIN